MAQNTVQVSSFLYPEDVTIYVAAISTSFTSLNDLTSAVWLNIGAVSEYTRESANASVQPAAFNVEHAQVLTKEAETINITIQEMNSSIVNILRGGLSQQVTTATTSSAAIDVLYSGGAQSVTPFMIWEYAKFSDNRTVKTYFPNVYYVSGGAESPKAQGTGEYRTMSFSLEARESTTITYNNRRVYRIEVKSTAST